MRIVITDLSTGQKQTQEDVRRVEVNDHYESEYLHLPHYHVIYEGGFRTNLPMSIYHVKKAAKLSGRRRRARARRAALRT